MREWSWDQIQLQSEKLQMVHEPLLRVNKYKHVDGAELQGYT